ncbi:hypothetical protein COP1_002215 [Malus domestica]
MPWCARQPSSGAEKQPWKTARFLIGLLKLLELSDSCLSEMAVYCFVKEVPEGSSSTSTGIIPASATFLCHS